MIQLECVKCKNIWEILHKFTFLCYNKKDHVTKE